MGACSTESPPRSGRWSEGVSVQAAADTAGRERAGAQLDEDGDLDVMRRPRAASDPDTVGPLRVKVHPVILTQEEDALLGGGAQESIPHNVIQIGKSRSGSPAAKAAPQDQGIGMCVCVSGGVSVRGA